jgi:hypothetical protein
MSIDIESATVAERTSTVYVSINQTFALWFVPFYKARVHLTTVLKLSRLTNLGSNENVGRNNIIEAREPAALTGPGQERAKYFIASQEDLYQVNELVNFLMPGVAPLLWFAWQVYATLLCVVGSRLAALLDLIPNRGRANRTKDKIT